MKKMSMLSHYIDVQHIEQDEGRIVAENSQLKETIISDKRMSTMVIKAEGQKSIAEDTALKECTK